MSGSQTQPPENSNTHMDQMHNPVQGPGYDEDDLGNTKIASVEPLSAMDCANRASVVLSTRP